MRVVGEIRAAQQARRRRRGEDQLPGGIAPLLRAVGDDEVRRVGVEADTAGRGEGAFGRAAQPRVGDPDRDRDRAGGVEGDESVSPSG